MQVVNESRVDFQYRLYSSGPIVSKTITSNVVSTDIINEILKVEKHVDKVKAAVFDILTYTIKLSNISNMGITNVFFQDVLSEDAKFISNSIKVNGVKKRCVNPEEGFYIGNIMAKDSIIISFKVVIFPKYSRSYISNCSDVIYDYIYNVEKPPIRVPIQTNEVTTSIENKLFKQINISNVLKLSSEYPPVYGVFYKEIKIDILKTKVVATPLTSTSNHREPSLYNLIIIGKIEYNILYEYKYTCYDKYNCIYKEKIGVQQLIDTEGFSSFLLVPYGIEYCSINNISTYIENISDIILNEKNLLINTSVLINITPPA